MPIMTTIVFKKNKEKCCFFGYFVQNECQKFEDLRKTGPHRVLQTILILITKFVKYQLSCGLENLDQELNLTSKEKLA